MFSPAVRAVTLTGFVPDEATGQPIAYASVRLDTPALATQSNNRGVFWLNRLAVGACRLAVPKTDNRHRRFLLPTDFQRV